MGRYPLDSSLNYNAYKATSIACCQSFSALCCRNMTDTSDLEASFLDQLGQRVRTMRALRGMSRKVLAKVSGISERYIAQLESGKGNVSIVLLRRVSNAMGAHLEDLIPSTEPAPDWAVIRDLLRKASPAQIAQAKDLLAGHGPTAHRA